MEELIWVSLVVFLISAVTFCYYIDDNNKYGVIGSIFCFIASVLSFIASQSDSLVCACVAIVLLIIAVILLIKPAREERERMRAVEAKVQAEMIVKAAAMGVSQDKLFKAMDDMSGITAQRERQEKRRIMTAAAVGDLMNGTAGAIVGAAMEKEKIEKEKQNDPFRS